jgi:DNA-binding MarR family transcriptional regulator
MKTPQRRKKDKQHEDPKISFSELQNIFKLMGNHFRLSFLVVLGKHKKLTLDQINGLIGGSFANISAHSRKLHQAGLIKKEHRNNFVLHSLTLNGKRALKALDLFNYSIE